MARPKTQSSCLHGCGPAYALDLCEPCYRFQRRTGKARDGDPPGSPRRLHRNYLNLLGELEGQELVSQARAYRSRLLEAVT